MAKNHCKTVASPKSWRVPRKNLTFITKPNPGAHSMNEGISLRRIMIDSLGLAKTSKEVNYIIHTKEILLDSKRVKDPKTVVGIFDSLTFPAIKKSYRILYGPTGQLECKEISESEASIKPTKILGKKRMNGKFQLSLSGGRCIVLEKSEYNVGDGLTIEVPSQKILHHSPKIKGEEVYLTGGKYKGLCGVFSGQTKEGATVELRSKEIIMTSEMHVFPLGKIRVEP